MATAKRIRISLAEDLLRATDETALSQRSSRDAVVEDALRWYLQIQKLPSDQASPEEIAAIERGRAEIARGEFVTFEEIKRDLAADLLEERAKKSKEASAG